MLLLRNSINVAYDTYSASWLSHSSINDYLTCPRAYYLKNIYKNPSSNRKISLVQPSMSLGSAVHEVLESLKTVPVEERLMDTLLAKYGEAWSKIAGKQGGFRDLDEEAAMKLRGQAMLEMVKRHPGPILKKATYKLRSLMKGEGIPSLWLSQEEGLILCGNIDWMQYVSEDDSIHIIDFKTGKNEEKRGSLQLPIYHLIAKSCQTRAVSGASYWYLATDEEPKPVALPSLEESHQKVLEIARDIKSLVQNRHFVCATSGCFSCKPYEEIINGSAEYLGVGQYNKDVYIEVQNDYINVDLSFDIPF
jgi:ATP-dependent helicase/DNAse subunit B